MAPTYGKLIGAKPVWAGFYARYEGGRGAYVAHDAPRGRYGYRIKVLWVVKARERHAPTITGSNLQTGAAIRFGLEGFIAQSPLLDSSNRTAGRFLEFPSYLYFDRAGCFELEARSATGSWRLVFGFGSS